MTPTLIVTHLLRAPARHARHLTLMAKPAEKTYPGLMSVEDSSTHAPSSLKGSTPKGCPYLATGGTRGGKEHPRLQPRRGDGNVGRQQHGQPMRVLRQAFVCLGLLGVTWGWTSGAAPLAVIDLGAEPARYEGVSVAVDPDAVGKAAYKTTKGTAGVVHFGYSWETMAVYEAVFRVKVADNTMAGSVGSIRYNCETTRFVNLPPELTGSLTLRGTDFQKPGVYQDFTLRWLAPQETRNGWALNTTGETELWFDTITVSKVRDIGEVELLRYLPDGAKPPPPPPLRTGPWRAHLMRGYFSDYYLFDLALPRLPGLRVTSSSFSGGCAGQPTTPAELYAYDVVIMAGTSISHLSIPQRLALVTWVKAGGGLFLLGGPVSFGQAKMEQSALAEVVPLKFSGPFDLQREHVVLAANAGQAAHPMLQGLDLAAPMVAFFRHQLMPREGASVLLGTAEKPVLVVGDCGKGRVACFLTPPMGSETLAAAGETPFWNDPRLPALFANVVRGLMTRPAPQEPNRWQPDAKPTEAAQAVIERLDSGGLEDLGTDEGAGKGRKGGGEAAKDIDLLVREGGAAAVPFLLQSMGTATEKADVRRLEWAIRPFVTKANYDELLQLTNSPHEAVRESATALLGKSNPDVPPGILQKALQSGNARLARAACRAAMEGRVRALVPDLKRLHADLKPKVEARRVAKYEGYWFDGVQTDDPGWPYADCTLALLSLGEKGYVADACDLLFLLHLQDIKVRSFIYLYNPKVPREAKAAERHQQRNAFLGPELSDLLERCRLVMAALPPDLHDEFRSALLAVDDYEKLQRLLYPAYDLMAGAKSEGWTAFRPQLEQLGLKLAIAAKRF